METSLIELLGFGRAISIDNPPSMISEAQRATLNFVKEIDFGINQVYFCDDFPAVFIKKIDVFDEETFANIALTHQKTWNFKKVLFLYVYNDVEVRIYNCSEKPFVFTSDIKFEQEVKKLELAGCIISEKENFKN